MSEIFNLKGRRVFVAGHRGMVGSALVRRLALEDCEVIVAPRDQVDLRDKMAVHRFIKNERPDVVILAAAKVGGIVANDSLPVDFLKENLEIQNAVIGGSFEAEVQKLLFLGSSCIYPKLAPQPIVESALLTGPLEPTNQWYAIAKIAGLKLCEAYRRQYGVDYISAMPTNLYGPGDNYDLQNSHVVPALIRKAHLALETGSHKLPIWGSGQVHREFLFVDDAADAMVFLLKNYSGDEHVNVGSGNDITIFDLAHLVCKVVGVDATIETDPSKPDGTPRKLQDVSRLFGMGWRPKVSLEDGLNQAYQAFLREVQSGAARLTV
jgi:GDP-L-fucose synthase